MENDAVWRMIPLLPPPPPEVEKPLRHVLTRALVTTGYSPPWIIVEDRQGQWLSEVVARPACERPRAIIALSSETALVDALRLGIGGALWLPPSTAAMQDALAAASCFAVDCGGRCDERLVETMSSHSERLLAVTWRNRRFWRRHLGERVLAHKLVALAEVCGVPAAVLPWPLLLVADGEAAKLSEAAGRMAEQLPELVCLQLPPRAEREGGMAEALRMVVKAEDAERRKRRQPPPTLPPQPVCELPGGRLVGYWLDGATKVAAPASGEWIAEPMELLPDGFRWRLQAAGSPELWVEDIVSVEQLEQHAGGHTRLSGWAAQTSGPGTPAGLLIQRLVEHARRLAVTLWLPNVDQTTLNLLMRQQGTTLWVDGPAVPGLS